LARISTFLLFLSISAIVIVLATIVFFATQIPSPQDLTNRVIPQATKIFDKNGELLYDIYEDQNRTPVKLADIPEYVKKATIAIEDKNFYNEAGFSVTGILRSFFDLIIHRRVTGGG